MNMLENHELSIIVCVDRENGIGKHGKIPWHVKEDIRYFKQKTRGKPCIVGRKTAETLSVSLKDRPVYVISNSYPEDLEFKFNPYIITPHLNVCIESASSNYPNCKEIMIIGGASIYKQVLDDWFVDNIYMTALNERDYECDTKFPYIRPMIQKQYNLESYAGYNDDFYGSVDFMHFKRK
jgi:dihydrofolate reductase